MFSSLNNLKIVPKLSKMNTFIFLKDNLKHKKVYKSFMALISFLDWFKLVVDI